MFLALYFWHNTGVTFALFRLSKDLKFYAIKVEFILTNFFPISLFQNMAVMMNWVMNPKTSLCSGLLISHSISTVFREKTVLQSRYFLEFSSRDRKRFLQSWQPNLFIDTSVIMIVRKLFLRYYSDISCSQYYCQNKIDKINSHSIKNLVDFSLKLRENAYSEVPNSSGTTAIYFEPKIGQKWPKSCIFM